MDVTTRGLSVVRDMWTSGPCFPAPRFCAFRLRCLTLSAVVALAVSAAPDPNVHKRQFDLPADAAEKSLKRFSLQSGFQVIFASDLVEGVRANAVKGTFAPMEAADRLLAGTPLRVVYDGGSGLLSVARIPSHERARPEKNG